MRTGRRLTMAGLIVAAAAVVLGVAVVPTHVSLGAGSLRCGTVLRPDHHSEIGALCGRAGSNQLRAMLMDAVILAVLACVPLIVEWMRPGRHVRLWAVWSVLMLCSAAVVVVSLGWVAYSPKSVFVDL